MGCNRDTPAGGNGPRTVELVASTTQVVFLHSMLHGACDTSDSATGRRFASPVLSVFVAAILVLTGFVGVGRLGANPIRHVEVTTLVTAPTDKPCERALRAGLCQILVAPFWIDVAGFDRVSEPAVIPRVPREDRGLHGWLTSPPFRPPRTTA